jgi:hypothetical protein
MMGIRLFVLGCLVGGCLVAVTGCDTTTSDSGETTIEQSTSGAAAKAERKREKAREKKAARKLAKARAKKAARKRAKARQRAAQAPPTTTEETPPPDDTQPASNCEPGYDPCVPPYPPDLDCSDLSGPYAVTGSDPHGLDRDGDGEGCE